MRVSSFTHALICVLFETHDIVNEASILSYLSTITDVPWLDYLQPQTTFKVTTYQLK